MKIITRRLLSILLFVVLILIFFVALNNLKNGSNYETDGDITYYYFPAECYDGVVPFNQIKSKNRDGAALELFKTGTISGILSVKNNNSKDKVRLALNKQDIGQKLYAGYYEDGTLGAIMYTESVRDSLELNRQYLLFKFYDEDGKRLDDIINSCAEIYADDITQSIKEQYGNSSIDRILVMYEYDDINHSFIRIRVGTEDINQDNAECSPEDYPELYLLSKGNVDCMNMLKAIISSSGDDMRDEILKEVSEKTAQFLQNEFSDSINKTDDFSVELYGYGLKADF